MKSLLLILLFVTAQAHATWSVTTYNIRNFDHDRDAGPTNISELKSIIKDVKSDVIGFQEVVNFPAFEDVVRDALPGYGQASSGCGGFGNQHLALVYNQSVFDFVKKEEDLSYTGTDNACGSLRPVLLVTLKDKKTSQLYTFGLIHLKAGSDERAFRIRWGQYQKLKALAAKYATGKLILLGDFNTTGYNVKNEDFKKFESFLSTSGMKTATQSLGCTNYWTGADQDPKFLSSILDHIVMPDSQFKQIQKVRVGAHCQKTSCRNVLEKDLGESYKSVSDHCPVQVTFK